MVDTIYIYPNYLSELIDDWPSPLQYIEWHRDNNAHHFIKLIIVQIINQYSNINTFIFSHFISPQRFFIYKSLRLLNITYTFYDYNISLYITPHIRRNIYMYRTNNSFTIQHYKNINFSNNLKYKTHFAQLIFSIKNDIGDEYFKNIMDILCKITH